MTQQRLFRQSPFYFPVAFGWAVAVIGAVGVIGAVSMTGALVSSAAASSVEGDIARKSPQVKTGSKSGNKVGRRMTKDSSKLSIQDAECIPFSPASVDWKLYSPQQEAKFREAYKQAADGNLIKAAEGYQSLKEEVEDFRLFYNRGVAEAAVGNLANAEVALKKAAHLSPQTKETYKLLSLVEKALGHEDEARFCMDRYLQL